MADKDPESFYKYLNDPKRINLHTVHTPPGNLHIPYQLMIDWRIFLYERSLPRSGTVLVIFFLSMGHDQTTNQARDMASARNARKFYVFPFLGSELLSLPGFLGRNPPKSSSSIFIYFLKGGWVGG